MRFRSLCGCAFHCGFEYMNPELPKDYVCPLCGHPYDDFEPIYEDAASSAAERKGGND